MSFYTLNNGVLIDSETQEESVADARLSVLPFSGDTQVLCLADKVVVSGEYGRPALSLSESPTQNYMYYTGELEDKRYVAVGENIYKTTSPTLSMLRAVSALSATGSVTFIAHSKDLLSRINALSLMRKVLRDSGSVAYELDKKQKLFIENVRGFPSSHYSIPTFNSLDTRVQIHVQETTDTGWRICSMFNGEVYLPTNVRYKFRDVVFFAISDYGFESVRSKNPTVLWT